MKRRFRLAAVLRARQAQEDAAKGAVLQARSDAEAAAGRRGQRERALAERPVPDGGNPQAYVAALSARQALAGELNLAERLAGQADDVVTERVSQLTDAAVRRRTMERLAERHASAARRAADRVGQQALDELASRRPGSREDER